uniref:Zinc finger BED domain-containing protein 1-like n=1 Tax=Labrus bergylta TaxID=56723 RepID=A0A3Q3L1M0_9LABR|nr:zinc finger BED domain-containing protein 1-like [Labrus bergylta]
MFTTKRRLLKMIVSTPQSLESAVTKSFKDFVIAQNPSLEILNKSVIRSELVRVYNEKRNELQSTLASADDIVLTCESWSHRAEDSLLMVGCHFVDSLGKLKSYLLETKGLSGDESAAIQKQLSAVMEAWGLEGKVHCVVRAGLPQLKGVKWMGMPCFANELNVMFKDLTSHDELSDVFRKCRDIVRFFKFDSEAEEMLREIQKKMEMEQVELILPCGDRWLLWLDMLEGLILQHEVMVMVLVQKKKKNLILDETESEKIQNIISALKPLKKVTSMMKGEGFQSISVMLPLLKTIMDDLGEEVKKGNNVAKIFHSKCKKNFGDINKHRLALMTFLDPRYKDKLGEQNKKNAIKELKQELTAARTSCSAAQLEALLEKYINYKPTSEDSNPFAWWRNTGKTKFDELSRLALKKLGIVSTAVPLERAFSSLGVQFCNNRSSIEPENLNMILFLHSNWPNI